MTAASLRLVPLLMFLVSCVALAQQPAPVIAAADNDTAVTIALIGFFSTLVALLIQMWREARNRRWDREDRAASRAEIRAATILLKREAVQTATEIAKLTKTELTKLQALIAEVQSEHIAAIRENTALTAEIGAKADAAYDSANNFAAKLAAIQRTLGANQGQLGDVQVTVEETHDLVQGIAAPPGDPSGGGL